MIGEGDEAKRNSRPTMLLDLPAWFVKLFGKGQPKEAERFLLLYDSDCSSS